MHGRKLQAWPAAFSQGERMGGCSGCSSMNEQAAANCICPLGGLEPAGSHRAQQRGQSPHTAVMWPPDGITETLAVLHSAKKKGKCGAPLTNAGLELHSFFYTELQFVPSCSRGFTSFQMFPPPDTRADRERKQNNPTHLNFTSQSVYHISSLLVT